LTHVTGENRALRIKQAELKTAIAELKLALANERSGGKTLDANMIRVN